MNDLVVDGNNLAVRIWKGMPELTTSKGQPIQVVFGVIKTIRAAIESFHADRVCVAWDGSPVARRTIFPEYKKHRREAREAFTEEEEKSYQSFKDQMELVKHLLPSFGIMQIYEPETEADDFIAYLSDQLEKVTILSEDKDFIQLVSDNVTLHRPMSKLTYTPDSILTHTKLRDTEQFLHYRVLSGDSSDGIPGIPGFGEKRAFTLINDYETLHTILSIPELNKGKIMNRLFDSKKLIARNLLLMDLTFSKEYLPNDLDSCLIPAEYDESAIKSYMVRYEFFSLCKSLKEFTYWFKNLSQIPVL